ncbi:hypothetical protein ATO6_15415 [Oceanicola sp. 22II-s10i]|uniref:hypothetical protein n=1 Tax=Oceanicola sp. 22II-s10i TaxID=1317116 RepID=UPI000B522160|nr:hypothetical protein [Oceanicola sp. 22II-s10i]OWU83817.1 hypothetical protein ATO6_15415 [Oceanicola sp. 22II-s10i]
MSGRIAVRHADDTDRQLIDAAIAAGKVTICPPAMPVLRSICSSSQPAEGAAREKRVGPEPRTRRRLGIAGALEWAFGVERAQLRFDEDSDGFGGRIGIEYVLMQRGRLRAKIDGGGRSPIDVDADLIADAVQWALPRSAALRVQDMARSMSMPWSSPVVPKVEPADWVCGRGGWRGRTADARRLGSEGWMPAERVNRLGRHIREAVKYTPITWAVTPQQVARRRRDHLDWWGDLLTVRTALRSVELRWTEITDAMPPMQPWQDPA